MGAKDQRDIEALPPWANEPDRVKLEISERLVFEKKQYAAAVPLISAMRAEGVTAPILDLLQGIAMREQRMYAEAERLLLTASRRMPHDGRVHEALCILYADTRAMAEAISSCERATKVDDQRASSWNNLGFLYLSSDRYQDALEALQASVDLDANEPRYRNNLALAHVAVGDTDSALRTLGTTHTRAEAYYNVGVAVERFDGGTPALDWYRQALKYDKQHADSVHAIARIKGIPTTTPLSKETDK
jgi:Flp pilus assembly protein TadD